MRPAALLLFTLALTLALPALGGLPAPTPTGLCGPGISENCVQRFEFEKSVSTDPCVPSDTRLCLLNGRFIVVVQWRTADGTRGFGHTIPVADGGGAFWFFGPSNPEMVVKVVPACTPPFNAYWVFLAPLTNVEYVVEVVDTLHSSARIYVNPLGRPAPIVQDTEGFQTCP